MNKALILFLALTPLSLPALAQTKVILGEATVSGFPITSILNGGTSVDTSEAATVEAQKNAEDACTQAGGKPVVNTITRGMKTLHGTDCTTTFHRSRGSHDSDSHDVSCHNTVAIVCEGDDLK